MTLTHDLRLARVCMHAFFVKRLVVFDVYTFRIAANLVLCVASVCNVRLRHVSLNCAAHMCVSVSIDARFQFHLGFVLYTVIHVYNQA